ncbi:type II toxin-antitoxin system RelE/ParE family toxin [Aminobacter anthyllidis]|nr:type II toxin-antitoxin system RelE/ParE family toxin [Aminobacter anthyllidis]MDH4988755.1 type II toxin-antitoxin system RelE/ParE family toxin [Aminobacter anthyllidis]
MSYRLTPQAMADIEAIGDYISQFNPAAATKLIRRMAERWELLATQPHSGAERTDLLPELRHVVLGEYVTFYRVEGAGILILRVLHGHRHVSADDVSS